MMPIKLTDNELDHVLAAAAPISVERRDAFLRQVASLLAGYMEIGPGVVHRVVAEAQRQFFDPPDLSHDDSRWRRR